MSEIINRELLAAIRKSDFDKVMQTLEQGADVEAVDAHGIPGLPLRIACFHGHLRIIAALLTCGAKPNGPEQAAPQDCLPLRAALRGQHKDAVELLLQVGALWPEDIPLENIAENESSDETEEQFATCEIEEIDISGCFGLDTATLTQDFLATSAQNAPPTRLRRRPSILNRLRA